MVGLEGGDELEGPGFPRQQRADCPGLLAARRIDHQGAAEAVDFGRTGDLAQVVDVGEVVAHAEVGNSAGAWLASVPVAAVARVARQVLGFAVQRQAGEEFNAHGGLVGKRLIGAVCA
ncbi:hypothetical protein D3C80_1579740 [compost metagenome]